MEIAYLAGIIDGEGSIHIGKLNITKRRRAYKNPQIVPCITVEMTDRDIPNELQARFGGWVKSRQRHDQIGRKRLYAWGISSKSGLKTALEALRPYLHVKRHHAWLMLEYLANITVTYQRTAPEEQALREGYHWAMRRLNGLP